MIIDTLEHLRNYVAMNPLFEEVLNFINQHDMTKLIAGRHDIKGNDVFVNIQEAKGKTVSEAVLEYHRKMIDIQVPISGEETYGYSPLEDLPEAEYKEDIDMALLPGVKPQQYVTCRPGQFVVFFPQDAHAPFITDAQQLHKAIFKIKA